MATSSNTKNKKTTKKKTTTKTTTTSTSPATATSSANNQNTISGLNKNNVIIPIASAVVGILIFSLIPYIVNNINLPLTGAALNVIPNGIILGYFITDVEFDSYFRGIIFAPIFNVVCNIATYALYKYMNLTPFFALTMNISLWILFVIGSLFVTNF